MDNTEKLDKILRGVERNAETSARLEKHQKVMNGAVAKHGEWINRYDIRVAEDVPDIQKKLGNMNIKLASVGGSVTVLIAIVYFLLRK